MPARLFALCLLALCLAGCDQLGIESAQSIAARREADGKAVGSACRHAARALEDCFALNRKVDKAAIFAGWREMSDYMRDNKIEPVVPQFGAAAEVAAKAPRVEGAMPSTPGDAKPQADAAAHGS